MRNTTTRIFQREYIYVGGYLGKETVVGTWLKDNDEGSEAILFPRARLLVQFIANDQDQLHPAVRDSSVWCILYCIFFQVGKKRNFGYKGWRIMYTSLYSTVYIPITASSIILPASCAVLTHEECWYLEADELEGGCSVQLGLMLLPCRKSSFLSPPN